MKITIKLRGEMDTRVLDGCEYEFGEAKEVCTLLVSRYVLQCIVLLEFKVLHDFFIHLLYYAHCNFQVEST